MSCVCSTTEIVPKVCKNPFSTLLAHSTVVEIQVPIYSVWRVVCLISNH